MTANDFRRLTLLFEETIPFNAFLGLRIGHLKKGFAQIILPFRPEFVGDVLRPAMHGGVIATIIDAAGGLAAFTHLPEGDRLSTVDIRIDYLNPGLQETLFVDAKLIRLGNRIAMVDSTAYQRADAERRIIATGKAVYNRRRIELAGKP